MELYGADWDGPIPTDDDAHGVLLDNLPPLLSSNQQEALTNLLPLSSTNNLSEEFMIERYSVAKQFVHQSCS